MTQSPSALSSLSVKQCSLKMNVRTKYSNTQFEYLKTVQEHSVTEKCFFLQLTLTEDPVFRNLKLLYSELNSRAMYSVWQKKVNLFFKPE